jgi:hypothetical protein
MVSDRMKNALELADKCWKKANDTSPEFVENYLAQAERLLLSKPYVRGDEFRSFCHQNGIARPMNLHPNVWVSGVRALNIMGWVQPMQKVEPKQSHNHMPSVTLWRSSLYEGVVSEQKNT